MATLREEEENPFANFDFDSAQLEENTSPFAEFDFTAAGFGQESDSLGYSFDRAMKAGGRGLSELLPRMGLNVPQGIQDYSAKLQEAGEIGMQDYVPEYQGEITQQSLGNVPGFLGEKLAENSTAMGITMFGLTLGQTLMKGPGVVKLVGAGITGATAGFNYLMLLDEAVETHAAAAGKTVDELSESELGNASFTAIQNAGLDFILPQVWARSLNKAGLPAKKSLKELAENLKTTDKEKIGSMLYKGAKQTLNSSLIEGGIESAQQANMMRTSVLGTAGINPESMITDFAVGAAGGAAYGSPVAVSKAREVNNSRRADKTILDFADVQAQVKAGNQYKADVKSYSDDFDKLLAEYDNIVKDVKLGKKISPELAKKFEALPGTNKPFNIGTGLGKIAPPKFDVEKNVADIIPTLYNAPEETKSFLGKVASQIKEIALNRSDDELKDIRKDIKTGKAMSDFMDIQGALVDTATGSGETQDVTKSYDTRRHVLIGKYVNRFERIRDTWVRKIPFMGEIGGNVRPAVNRYVAAKLEEKNEKPLYNLAQAESEVLALIGADKKRLLDENIVEIAQIQEEIWAELSKALGKDGLTIGHQKGYLTRSIDYKAVKKNSEAFYQSLLGDVGLPEVEAKQVLENILNDVEANVFTSEQIRAGIDQKQGLGKSSFEIIRDGRWDALDTKFRNKDTLESIEKYLLSAVSRIASAEAFGGDRANKYSDAINGLKKVNALNDAQTEKLWGLYDAYHNVYKKPRTDNQRAAVAAMKGLSTITSISYLGLATISSWTEPMWIGQRNGWYNMLKASPAAAGYFLKGLMRSTYAGGEGQKAMSSFGRDLLRVMGMATNPAMSERVDKLMAGDRNIALNYFFRTPAALFLTQYTNFVRVWTAAAGLKMIQEQYSKIDTMNVQSNKLLAQELRENGLSMDDFRKLGGLANGNIEQAILDDAYLDTTFTNSKGETVAVRDVLVPWMRKITTDVALEPTAGNRPLWMSDPNLMLIAQLKSFPILFGNTIARRLNAKMNPQFCSPDFVGKLGTISAISAAIGMAALALALKDAIKGVEEERGPVEIISAVGVPLISEVGSSQIGGLVAGPGLSYVDGFTRKLFGEEPLGDTAEEIFKLFLNATTGRIGSETLMGD
jgi:hypothetical protein